MKKWLKKLRWRLIIAVIVVIWIGLLAGIWATSQNWTILAAIGTWLLAGGIVFAIVQVREARKSTNAQLAVELFRELRSKE